MTPKTNDGTMGNEKSNSSSSNHISGSVSSLQVTQPRRHRRSISDTFVLVVAACFSTTGNFQTNSKGAEKRFKLNGDGSTEGSSSDLPFMTEIHSLTEQRKWGRSFDPILDHKKIKRSLLGNRVSAQKSGLTMEDEYIDEYIEKLENDINTVKAKILWTVQQLAIIQHQNAMARNENNAMKQKLEIMEKENKMKEAEHRALKDERDMLALTFLMKESI